MKKFLYVILAALLVLSLAGCKGKQNNTPSDNPEPETETAEIAQPETEAPKTAEFARGSWDASEKVFTSDFSGLKITLTDDFRYYDDAELAETYLSDSAFSWDTADFETMTTIPDCGFIDGNGNNVGILYENVAAEGASNISEEDYLDIVTKQLGAEGEQTYYDRTLSGNTYLCWDKIDNTYSNPIYQTVAVKKYGGYICVIVFTALEQGGSDQLVELFNK